jgi:uncharacterized protein (DUF305 family)
MQINIDKKTGSLVGVVLVLLGLIAGILIRGDQSGMSSDHMGHDMGDTQSSDLASADVMFLQMMIPHHQQAIEMSGIAVTRSQNPELLALAKDIAAAQSAEIITMKKWLTDAGASQEMGQMGQMDHDMSGMLSAEDLVKLESASGKEFDQLWLQGMTGHHDGAIDMVDMIKNAKNAEVKAFGLRIIADQSAQIEQMKKMLAQL